MEFLVYPVIALLFVGIFTREVIAPASRNPCDRRWMILATVVGALGIASAIVAGLLLEHQLRAHALFPGIGALPAPIVGLVSFLLTSFVFYWWHRAIHASDLLWRVFHQLHHSPRRIEVFTAFFAHPLDTAAAVSLSALSSYLVLGASPLAAALGLFYTALVDLFIHADIRTPRWIGYLVQRPEMHTVHHRREHHRQNYGLPLWDMLFGTWSNPTTRESDCGFDEARSGRVYDMLMLRDVHHS